MESVRPPKHKCERAMLDALMALGGKAHRASITRHATQSDLFTTAERCAPAPASKGQYETYLHYSLSWALTSLKNQRIVDNDGRGHWRLTT